MLNQHLADLTMTLSSCPVQVIVAVRSGQSYASPSAKQVPHHLSFAKQGSKAEQGQEEALGLETEAESEAEVDDSVLLYDEMCNKAELDNFLAFCAVKDSVSGEN